MTQAESNSSYGSTPREFKRREIKTTQAGTGKDLKGEKGEGHCRLARACPKQWSSGEEWRQREMTQTHRVLWSPD
jgi:hypothetical protein